MLQEEILGKKCNLTRSRARNDQITRQIKGFSFCDFKNKAQHSREDLFLFSPQNLDFKHSLDMKMSLEEVENKRF